MAKPSVFPSATPIRIRLDDNPRYRGSTHDDETARKMGFKAALVPGAFLYGHASRFAIEAWGLDWATRGAMEVRFRRPVYNGDVVTFHVSEATREGERVTAALSARNEDGEDVLTGWLALPDEPVAPPTLASLPVPQPPDGRRPVTVGDLAVGEVCRTAPAELSADDLRASLDAFDERHTFYAETGLVHSGGLMRRAMFDVNSGYAFPAPLVLVGCETQHFAPVKPGRVLSVSAVVSDVYERRGRHYFQTDEHLIVDGRSVAARFRRTQIYA
ncbi:MaoC family dehydratase [Alsobacter sp. SYSU M60028]|uniref:MaoC family dehydratase n=1 Tax=Alsobacter ponti TaxID=2962936 RepID=A0ABT1LHB9_9HYPH|nr:MaoC family dehydratase [Alsobacter ponti]MCP8940839.1 MaoC family dehydratase [Alsobacter ponti]